MPTHFLFRLMFAKKFNVTEANGDAWMKVYNNLAADARLQKGE
ncbi:MAG: hypothetical protein WDM90_16380 [Ferruginibacter sp.]